MFALAASTSLVYGDTANAACSGTTVNKDYAMNITSFKNNCTNIAPPAERAELFDDYTNNGYNIMYVSWLSVAGNPTLTSLTVDAGTSSIPLQLNVVSYRRTNNNNTVQFRQHYTKSDIPYFVTNKDVTVDYPDIGHTDNYRIFNPIPFSAPLNPALTVDKNYTYNVTRVGVNKTSTPSYYCVANGSSDPNLGRTVSGYGSWAQCSPSDSTFTFLVHVRSAWTTSANTYLYVSSGGAYTIASRDNVGQNGYPAQPSLNIGDTVYWLHRLEVNGTVKNQQFTINRYPESSETGLGVQNQPGANWTFGSTTATLVSPSPDLIRNDSFSYSAASPRVVTASDAGKQICRRLRWTPSAYANLTLNNSIGSSGNFTCYTVAFSQSLVPLSPTGIPLTALPGVQVTGIDSSVSNKGLTDSQANVTAGLVRFVVTNSAAIPGAGTTTLAGNANFHCDVVSAMAPSSTDCAALGQRTGVFPVGDTSVASAVSDDLAALSGLKIGDYVCYTTIVNNYETSKSDLDWSYSEPTCVEIKKAPSVHILSNDVRVGSGFTPGDSTLSSGILSRVLQGSAGKSYGSWGEYGVLAPGEITNFASASGLNLGASSSAQSAWSNLTFANNNTVAPNFGTFVSSTSDLGLLPDIFGYAAAGKFNMKVVNNTNWPGGAADKNLLVDKRGQNVTISGDIIRPVGAYGSVADMPQMIILADNINIHGNVNTIDAWLVASGTIDTCSNGPSKFSGGQCDNGQLTINGPVIANKLLLNRSFGADSAATLNTPAERIDLKADTYVWAYNQSRQSGTLQTVSQRELPPRY